jgi:hypothetical protein
MITKGPTTCTEFSLILRKHATAAPLYKERAAAAGQTAHNPKLEDIGMDAVNRHTPGNHSCYGHDIVSLLRLPVRAGPYRLVRSRIFQLRPTGVVWNWEMVLWSSLIKVEQDMARKLRQETWYCVRVVYLGARITPMCYACMG